MTRNRRSCIPVILLTVCGALIFGQGQTANAHSTGNTQSRTMLAEAKADPPGQGGAKTATDKTNATAGNTMNEAAQIDELKTEQTLLRQMAEAIRHTRRPVIDMLKECLQPLAPQSRGVGGELDIREGDIIPDIPNLAELAGKYAPPRKKYMKLFMAQLSSMIPLLQDEIDNLVIPDSEKEFAAQPLEDIDGYMGDIEQYIKKLKSIAKSGDFNQVPTINQCRGLDASCKAIDEARKKLLHVDETTERKDEKLEKQESKK